MFDDFGTVMVVFFLLIISCCVGLIVGLNATNKIEIQDIKQVDNGYYITINDDIYYSEVENEK